MQHNEDPWEWDSHQVAQELVRVTEDESVGDAMRTNRIDGVSLLTILTRENLKEELGVLAFGTRGAIMRHVEAWRRKSQKYQEYVASQDRQRFSDKLKDMVQEHELQKQFQQLVRGKDRPTQELGSAQQKSTSISRGNLALPVDGRFGDRRSLSPLPDLGSMGLEKPNEDPIAIPRVPLENESRGQDINLDGVQIEPMEVDEEPEQIATLEVDEEPEQIATLEVDEEPEQIATLEVDEEPEQVATLRNVDHSTEMSDHSQPTLENDIIDATTEGETHLRSMTSDRVEPTPTLSIVRQQSEHSKRRAVRGYLGSQKLLVDDLFYGDRNFEIDGEDETDNFYIGPSETPVGIKCYVEKQIRHFLISPEMASTINQDGLHRTAIKPYRASLLRKHYKQSVTVFDVRGKESKVYKSLVDDIDGLAWNTEEKSSTKNDGQRVTFGEDPEAIARPKYNYNDKDNSLHNYDYLFKWMKMENDITLPEFGDSGSEGEYDISTWREIEEREGGVLPKIPARKPLVKAKVDKGKKPMRADYEREPEGSEEELDESDVDGGREDDGAVRQRSPLANEPMELDQGSTSDIPEAEDGFRLSNEDAVDTTDVTLTPHNHSIAPNIIDLTIDDGSEDEAPRPPKRRTIFDRKRPEMEDRRRPERERKRTKRYPEEEDLVLIYSDDEAESSSRRRRKVVAVVEDMSAKASRESVHRLVKARLKRAQLEEQKRKMGSAPELEGKIQINVGKYANEDHIFIHPEIANSLKPHQIKGVRFLWGELVQGKRNKGALLAHTMGLGKTFQIIALLHTIAVAGASTNPRVQKQIPAHMHESKSLVVCPAGLVDNWWDEFHEWLPMDETTHDLDLTHIGPIRKIDSSSSTARIPIIRSWYEEGGVLILSYNMLRILASGDEDPPLECANIKQMLLEGPNIIVADEAHYMKNSKSALSKVARQFKSESRIALTGSPLSNNLIEYWTMIEWIDPTYLGPEREFQANYVRPIYDGLYIDSTRGERRESLKKLRVLKKILEPKVERADITAIQNFLPSKTEFLITVPLTELQLQLYNILLDDIKSTGFSTFDTMHLLSLVNNHPQTVVWTLEQRNQKKATTREDVVENLDLELTSIANMMPTLHSAKALLSTVNTPKSRMHSYRTRILHLILKHSIAKKDKVLVFTHSIPTLDLLQWYLEKWRFKFQRLDGATDVTKRQQSTKDFNAGTGNADVFIISTKAGGLGLNLFGANRVVIFDFRWTPMWEQQAVGRAYRIGQKKPVFVYRLVAGGTYEDRLRNMVDFKTQLQTRVIDQKDPRRSSTKLGTMLLKPPQDVEKEELDEFIGKDEVLDHVLRRVDFIRKISYTQTFIPDDDDVLDEQEKADADAELQRLQQLRSTGLESGSTNLNLTSAVIPQLGGGGRGI